MAALDPPLAELLPRWLARQRWYTGKGSEPRLRQVGVLRVPGPSEGDLPVDGAVDPAVDSAAGGLVGIEDLLVLDESPRTPVLYQVPLAYRDAPLEGAAPEALVATAEHSDLGTLWIYDACHDPAGAAALLRALTEELELTGEGLHDGGPQDSSRAHGHRTGLLPALRVLRARVLGGEQSNTSVVIDTVDATTTAEGAVRPVILKVFRVLHAGDNPDVEVQQALALAGADRVPQPVGDLLGQWPGPDGQQVNGHLALAQEFLPGSPDAWRVTRGALERGEDPADRARALGEATAEVHTTLAVVLPTAEPDVDARGRLMTSWGARQAEALLRVPALRQRDDEIRAVFTAAVDADWPRLQRIHGDYHLGQVLDVPGRGWVLLDFEGEPLRPLAERILPDLPERDVAGMLRSYDYAAASVALAGGLDAETANAWATRAREAFLDGYTHLARSDPREQPALLRALELDKALYEVAYEASNRPDWLPVPLRGIERILA
ncbi:trehalose biosynthesis protein [Georgenia halophila]|uniref:Maltokinase n=1 Tax=Georgenia halophila TaxID=620889 RepID=A0ABP8L013_9MICO